MTLRGYVAKRLLEMIPLLIGITLLVFIIIHSVPGDPAEIFFGMRPGVEYNPKDIEAVRIQLGLDRPLYEQYLSWIIRMLHGDLGHSYVFGTAVSYELGGALLNTLKLQIPSIILSFLIAIFVGVTSATKQYSKTDYAGMSFAIFFWSMPWFWFSLMMIFTFSLYLGWFPTYGIGNSPIEQVKSLVLPVVVLGLTGAGFLARLVRSCMLEVLRQDYVRTARAKGVAERVVIYKHALRNAVLPVITVMGLYLGYAVSGTAVVETVFAYPGIGQLLVNAASYRDYPMIMAATLVISVSVVVSIFVVDILCAYLDPRIRY